MASVNYEKLHIAGEVKAIMRHCDKDERVKHNHANKDIDKSLSHTNIQTRDYKAACEYYDKRIALLDSKEGANKRKDRVTAFSLCIPCPADIPDDKHGTFFKLVFEEVAKQYGQENIVTACFHRDERHTYCRELSYNVGEPRVVEEIESLDHAHIIVIPEVEGKLNGKKFSSVSEMNKLNKNIHKACQTAFGVNFMTGERMHSKEDVETLKERSRKLELKKLERENEERTRENEERAKQLDRREKFLQDRAESTSRTHKAAWGVFNEVCEYKKRLDEQEQQYKAKLSAVNGEYERMREYSDKLETSVNYVNRLCDGMANLLQTFQNPEEKEEMEEIVKNTRARALSETPKIKQTRQVIQVHEEQQQDPVQAKTTPLEDASEREEHTDSIRQRLRQVVEQEKENERERENSEDLSY